MKDRIKKLLANGLKASEVAAIVGCSPSYIAQLLKDENFKKEVEILLMENQTANSENEHFAKRYERVEHKILNRMEDALETAELPQLTRALEVIGKRRDEALRPSHLVPANPLGVGQINNQTNIHITQIALPAHAVPKAIPTIQRNEQNEIIAINNKALAPMSSAGVKNIFNQMNPAPKDNSLLVDESKVVEVPQSVFDEL